MSEEVVNEEVDETPDPCDPEPEHESKSDSDSEAASDGQAFMDAMQAQADKEMEQGYRGVATDPIPNREYGLLSGPDGPVSGLDSKTRSHQPVLPDEVNS